MLDWYKSPNRIRQDFDGSSTEASRLDRSLWKLDPVAAIYLKKIQTVIDTDPILIACSGWGNGVAKVVTDDTLARVGVKSKSKLKKRKETDKAMMVFLDPAGKALRSSIADFTQKFQKLST